MVTGHSILVNNPYLEAKPGAVLSTCDNTTNFSKFLAHELSIWKTGALPDQVQRSAEGKYICSVFMATGCVGKLTQQGKGLPAWVPAGGAAGLCRPPHQRPSKRAVGTAFLGSALHSLLASDALHDQMMTCSQGMSAPYM